MFTDCGWARSHRPSAVEDTALEFDLADDRRQRDSDWLKIDPIHARARRRRQLEHGYARKDVDLGLGEVVEINVATKRYLYVVGGGVQKFDLAVIAVKTDSSACLGEIERTVLQFRVHQLHVP